MLDAPKLRGADILLDPVPWSLAFSRFGLGARPGDGARKGDPREALIGELNAPAAGRLEDPALGPTPEILADLFAFQEQRKAERDAADLTRLSSLAMPEPGVAALMFPRADAPAANTTAMTPSPIQKAFRAEAALRFRRACGVEFGFVERLVAFWSNHFCVSVAKSEIGRAAAGAFEREAIRPHVTGRFADMLLAVEKHPAMLNFLDNAQSIGPNSVAGHNQGKGLNENLAREILELHTMGVGSGYTQGDVTQLAYILTGWTFAGRDGRLGPPGTFAFNPRAHEPLAVALRDRLYVQEGVAQGEAALVDLAREPATARHVAFKFARHFVADVPPPALVDHLTQVFQDTDGNLRLLATALIEDPLAWAAPRTKLRNPWELTVAAFRAFARDPGDAGAALNALNLLGMPLWEPAGPNGFSDVSSTWGSPEGAKMRLELAAQFARGVKNGPRPPDLVDDALGADVSPTTREAVLRAETAEQAYALALMAPEFQRR